SGDAGFELGSEMSSLSFHMSDFGVICPSQTSQSFNKTLAPFCGTTSYSVNPLFPAAQLFICKSFQAGFGG
ncbi:MAG: hypothetical protein ACK57I_12835, partial [Akkermansiaceae bacterium]